MPHVTELAARLQQQQRSTRLNRADCTYEYAVHLLKVTTQKLN